jgi:hypothetical protein
MWEEIDTPDVLLTARCSRCHRVVGKYWSHGDAGWEVQGRNRCECDPWPVLPSGDELARHLAVARRRPPARAPTDARLIIRI